MKPVAIFYHCLFFLGDPPQFSMNAYNIVVEQMEMLRESGLLSECKEMIVGINGGPESQEAAWLALPSKAKLIFHGLQSKSENLTIVEIERWVQAHLDWNILYFHAKGCTRGEDQNYLKKVSEPWRRAMMGDLVWNWRYCVWELEKGHDIVCSHWMWNMADGTQHIPAGNFLWITGRFAANLPSMFLRACVKNYGISAAESRWEAEVKWGNGRTPRVSQIRPNGGGGVPWVRQDGKTRLVVMQ